MSTHTPGPWFVSGVRFRMNGGDWHSISRYDEALKRDENVACVGYDSRTGEGLSDARLIAAAPDLLAACKHALTLLEPFDDPDLSLGLGSDALTPLREAIAKSEGRS